MREIFFIQERCVECGACRAACIAEHKKNHALYAPVSSLPMARKRRVGTDTTMPDYTVPHPVRCVHCDEPLCKEACISGSIGVADRVYNNWNKCVGCFMCIMNCPYGAILPFFNKAVRCDECLFTEKPACVRACPWNALVFMEADRFLQEGHKKRWKERIEKETPLLKAKA